MSGIVAIVGRPNVGKSTLFNRLTGERKAIVDDLSGVTRDRQYGKVEWGGESFTIIDTGGFVKNSEDVFEREIENQIKIAISESDVILFMVDVVVGITNQDLDMADLLRKKGGKVLMVVNKVDNSNRYFETSEWYKLGFGELYTISAVNGGGTGELLDEIIRLIPKSADESIQLPRIAIIGRPNVGKSSLTNALLGNERNIVTDIPGTTRDSIDSHYQAFGYNFLLVDTAGVRRKKNVSEDIEFYSVMRSIRAIETADVCVLVTDAKGGFKSQELNLFRLCEKNGKGIVIVVNKWDLINEKETNTIKELTSVIYEKTAPFNDIPVIFTSVPKKQRIFKVVETAMEVYNTMNNHIPTHQLNEYLLEIINQTPPPSIKGKYIKIKYVSQLKTNNQTFLFFCNLPQYIGESYKRFLENKIRARFNFTGVPLKLFFRQK